MKFAIDTKVLCREFDFLRRGVPKVDSLTQGWLTLTVPNDSPASVVITATSHEHSLESRLANLEEGEHSAGEFRLSNLKLDELISTLPDQIVTFESSSKSLTMTWADGHCKMMANWQSAPAGFKIGEPVTTIEVDPAAFAALISKLKFSYPPDGDVRIPGLKFVCADRLTVTSTNGKAIGIMNRPMVRPAAGSFILPVAVCEDVAALLRDNKSEPLVLQFHQHHLRAVCGHRVYTTSYGWQDAKFPDVSRAFSDMATICADVLVADAKQALKRATAACTYDANESFRVRIALTPGQIAMETEESNEVIGKYNGEPVSFVVNSKALGGVLDAIATPSVEFTGSTGMKPWVFRDTAEHASIFVLAPMAAL